MSARLALLAAASAQLGCAGGGAADERATQRLSPADFRSAEVPAQPTGRSPAAAAESDRPTVISAREARGGDRDVLTLVGRPASIDRGIERVGGPRPAEPDAQQPREITEPVVVVGGVVERDGVVVDEMVGQINGRPVYAAEFLSSLDDLLAAEAIEKTPQQWLQIAGQLIQNQLLERIRDELLIAEFNAGLTFEQRVGLFAFVEQIQQGIIDRDLGSAARADERLQTQENTTLRGKAEAEFNREIVFEQLRREVTRKVQVSWRDIERYYEQNIEVFQPPATARLRVLRVDPAARQRVEETLGDASTVAEVIANETTFRASDGGLITVQLGSGGLAAAEFFGPAELNEPATRLAEGGLSEPIEFGGNVWWMYLEAIEQPQTVSLYEAQNRIEQLIRAEREQVERARYFERLFGSSTVTEQQIAEMRDRLIEFAAERYLVQEEQPGG